MSPRRSFTAAADSFFTHPLAMNAHSPLTTREKIALAVSAAIVISSIIYWVMQIGDVMETLKAAYGG